MKRNISIVILALLVTGFVACINSDTDKTPASPTDTSGKRQMMVTDEIYTCKMHHDVMSIKPAKCPKCGMTLVKQKMSDEQMKMMKEGKYIKPTE